MNFSSVLASFFIVCVTLAGGGALFWHLQSTYQAELRLSKEVSKKLERQLAEKNAKIQRLDYVSGENQSGCEKLRQDYQTLNTEATAFRQSEEYIYYQMQVAEKSGDTKRMKELADYLRNKNPQSRYLASVDQKVLNTLSADSPEFKDRFRRELTRLRLEAHGSPSEAVLKTIDDLAVKVPDQTAQGEFQKLDRGLRRILQTQFEAFKINRIYPVTIQSLKSNWKRVEAGGHEYQLVPMVQIEVKNRGRTPVSRVTVRVVYYDPFDNRELGSQMANVLGVNESLGANLTKVIMIKGTINVRAPARAQAPELEQAVKGQTLFADIYLAYDAGQKEVRLATVPVRHDVDM